MSSAELQLVEGDEQDDKLVGATIDGRYEVESILGEGGMGLVYKARHIVLNKPLALKVLRPDVSRDEEIITRFRQEAQSASAIGNQHIIDISDFGELQDKSTYFVMEFLDGVDLTGAIEQGGHIDAVRTVHIAKQLCQALGAAHDAGIVHRDLKPDNIYLIRRGGDSNFVKVLDFGIAKVGGSSSKLTRAGQVFGTPHYMSPEQCAGSGVDHRTDVYALGIILYEMTTGEVPFDADNLMGILTKHLYEEPVKPRERNPEIPEELELVILKAIAKQADVRYQTMYELLEDLQRVEAGVGTMARETTKSFMTGSTAVEELPAPPPTSKAPMVIGAVLLLLGIAGGGAAYVMTQEDPAPIVETPPEQPPEQPPVVAEEPPEIEPTEMVEEPVGQVEPVLVRITSDPENAEVWREDELIGRTPVEIPRPDGDARLRLELRADGYQTRAFTISALTQREVPFRLERTRRRNGHMRGMTAMATTTEMVVTMEPATMMESVMMDTPMMRTRPATEVLDPWANE